METRNSDENNTASIITRYSGTSFNHDGLNKKISYDPDGKNTVNTIDTPLEVRIKSFIDTVPLITYSYYWPDGRSPSERVSAPRETHTFYSEYPYGETPAISVASSELAPASEVIPVLSSEQKTGPGSTETVGTCNCRASKSGQISSEDNCTTALDKAKFSDVETPIHFL
jgi:hypothetical protein